MTGVPVTPDYAVPSRAPGLCWAACGLPRPLRRGPRGAGTLHTLNFFPLVLEQEGWGWGGPYPHGEVGGHVGWNHGPSCAVVQVQRAGGGAREAW